MKFKIKIVIIIFLILCICIVFYRNNIVKEKYTHREKIKGAILIYSCHKYLNSRVKELKESSLSKKEYNGWKVFFIIGDPFLKTEYKINDDLITIKCEDSYIHLLKKVVLSIKTIMNIYDIEEGILRCGDDLVIIESKMLKFLNMSNKSDYMGVTCEKYKDTIEKKFDNFMVDYFNSHQNDLLNPLNGIKHTIEQIQKFNVVPDCLYTGGVVVFLSKKSCEILIKHLEEINWDIFLYNDSCGYPYITEDIGIGYILKIKNINATQYKLYSDDIYNSLEDTIDTQYFAYHTNKYKYNRNRNKN